MALIRLFSMISAVLLIFSSCAADEEKLLSFRGHPASFTADFPSPYGDVSCAGSMDGERMTLTLVSPERSAGITVICDAVSCVIRTGNMEIPLSQEASSFLHGVYEVMFTAESGDVPRRSREGNETVLTFEEGTLILDENLLPCAAECTDMNGEARQVRIGNYTLLNTEIADEG